MTRNLMFSVGYALRWLGWGVQWLVIAPLGTLTLAGVVFPWVVVLAWHGGDTPGQALMQYAEFDQTLAHLLLISWLTLAALYAGVALAVRCIPSRMSRLPVTGGRSVLFTWGRPANDLAEHAEHKDK